MRFNNKFCKRMVRILKMLYPKYDVLSKGLRKQMRKTFFKTHTGVNIIQDLLFLFK